MAPAIIFCHICHLMRFFLPRVPYHRSTTSFFINHYIAIKAWVMNFHSGFRADIYTVKLLIKGEITFLCASPVIEQLIGILSVIQTRNTDLLYITHIKVSMECLPHEKW